MTKLKYPLPYYVRTALNLEPWNEFAKNQIDLNRKYIKQWLPFQQSDELYRGIGTTTKMLVQAVYWSQNKKVYIKGYNLRYTEVLVDKAKNMCMELALSPNNINPKGNYPKYIILTDHYLHQRNIIQHELILSN